MKILRAIATVALAATCGGLVLPQPTHADTPSAATADHAMFGPGYRGLAVAATTDGMMSSRPENKGKRDEPAASRQTSPSVLPYQLNWLDGGGG